MSITTQDIHINQPAVVSDQDFAGGRMSGNRVIDGELNNLFSDSTRLDRTTGRTSLRKAFSSVESANVDPWLGVHAIITEPASDPGVFVSMFGLDDHTDQRSDAQQWAQAYATDSALLLWYLQEMQPEGAQTLTMWTDDHDRAPPQPGDAIKLEHDDDVQYVRVREITDDSTFFVSTPAGNRPRRVVTVSLYQALAQDWPGDALTTSPNDVEGSRIRSTSVATAKRHYSVHELTAPADLGDVALQVASIRTPIAPAVQQQSPVTGVPLVPEGVSVIAARADGEGTFDEPIVSDAIATAGTFERSATRSAVPGSVTVRLRITGSSTIAIFSDDGRGNLDRDSTSEGDVPAEAGGTVDYASGEISISGLSVTGSLSAFESRITYRPAAAIAGPRHSDAISITEANRQNVYSRTLSPAPVRGALRIRYRSGGRWITLQARGDGSIGGALSSDGSGTLQSGGQVNLTLALPDIGTAILFDWGSAAHYLLPDSVQWIAPRAVINIGGAVEALNPGSVQLSWGSESTAGDDGAGNLTGDAEGSIDYANGVIYARLLTEIDGGTITITYDALDAQHSETPDTTNDSPTLGQGEATAYTLGGIAHYGADETPVHFADDGAGNLVSILPPPHAAGSQMLGYALDVTIGTVNYGTGALSFTTSPDVLRSAVYDPDAHSWSLSTAGDYARLASVTYATGTAATSDSALNGASQWQFRLIAPGTSGVVPGSLMLERDEESFQVPLHDDGGALRRGGQTLGSLTRETGVGSISRSEITETPLELIAALVTYGEWTTKRAHGRVDAEGVIVTSFTATYTRDGETEPDEANADGQGDITGAGGLVGSVASNGVYALSWDDAILPASSYGATTTRSVPSTSPGIGIDPTRLPADGRVQTVRADDVLVVHHTDATDLPDPVQADTAYSLRPNISLAEVFDAEGERVPTDRFTVDQSAGEITFPSPLDLDGFEQPLTVRHRIEDMVQCGDADISGRIAINSPLTHDYPADGNAFVSSALILGQEIAAAAFNVFTQQSWTDEWSDSQIGPGTDGQLDLVNHPIEVTNQGAIRERWRIEFTSVTAFRIIGETVGQVATGDTSTDVSPINPATGVPYFTIRADAWSAGWNIGNQVRFNTEGAHAPIWINRTTLPGDNTQDPTDQFRLEARGDAN